MKTLLSVLFLFISLTSSWGQSNIPYKNARLPIENRVMDLIQRMTPEEKFYQLFSVYYFGNFESSAFKNGISAIKWNIEWDKNNYSQYSYNEADSIIQKSIEEINKIQHFFVENTRLGIPAIILSESLHGVQDHAAISYPQSIAMAATFDTALMYETAHSIALETKKHGFNQVLSPVINLGNDVRWGRTEETYGEDPYLCSVMGLSFVRAFEQLNIATTPKHFIANVGDGGRDSYPIHLDDRTLNNLYFPPFKTCIQEGGSRSIMSAYNSVNGFASGMNTSLLQQKLKKEWGFAGYVISDAGAVGGANVLHNTSSDYANSGKLSIENGLDVIYQGDIHHDSLFIKPFLDGSINTKTIDSAVARVLRLKFELGLFEHPYTKDISIDWKKHQQVARRSATESMVLLKNENHLLPLQKDIQNIAVIGPDAIECRTGGYSGSGVHKVSVLEGVQQRAGKNIAVHYAAGCQRINDPFQVISAAFFVKDSNHVGLLASYFKNIHCTGLAALERMEETLQFHYTFSDPAPQIPKEFFSVVYNGNLRLSEKTTCHIGLEGNDGFKMYINDKLVIDRWEKIAFERVVIPFTFQKDKIYRIKIEYYENVGNASLKLIWDQPSTKSEKSKIHEAIAISKKSDVIVFCAGIEEGEFQDRSSLRLTGNQEQLLQELISLKKPIVVLLFGGSAVQMNEWHQQVGAILETWYGGEEQGNAVAALLFGDENPSGKLPITFPRNEGQLPLVYNHEPTGRGDDYINESGLPLYPFGFGMSYTAFSFNDKGQKPIVIDKNASVPVSFTLKNVGDITGTEVVQVYVQRPNSRLTQPVLALKYFERITLAPGQSKDVRMVIPASVFKQYNEKNEEELEAGKYRLMIGNSSRNLPIHIDVEVLPSQR